MLICKNPEKQAKTPERRTKKKHFQVSKKVGNGFPLPKYF
jgi:hypothetical protein